MNLRSYTFLQITSFSSNLDFRIFIAIMIAIENAIRVDRTLIEYFQVTLVEEWGGTPIYPASHVIFGIK